MAAFGLTPREAEILTLALDGRTNADIGELLGITASTVKTTLERVSDKLQFDRERGTGIRGDVAALIKAGYLVWTRPLRERG